MSPLAVDVISHPLAKQLVSELRDKLTPPEHYRRVCHKLTTMLVLEATTGLQTASKKVDTPLETTDCDVLGEGLAVVPILRAGLGMLDAVTELFDDVKVGYIGLERAHDTAVAHRYYCKLPDLKGRRVLCLDPMLATGGSASQAISFMKANGAERVVMVSVIAAPEGVSRLNLDHPDVRIVTAALDRELDPRKYILPGLGDFGDRLFGTF
ncbi:MAG: uracil phosphoribosyltransferase [Fimbriimonadaceae bacterium]